MGVFPISGLLVKSLINKNCDNTWTSNNINIKLGPVTKIDKRNRSTQKNDTASSNYDVIDIFTIYVWFAAIWKPDFEHKVNISYILINSSLLSYKPENRTTNL